MTNPTTTDAGRIGKPQENADTLAPFVHSISEDSLRDWFAGQALSAWLGNPTALAQLERTINEAKIGDERLAITIDRVLAKRSYMTADAMLAARKAVAS